MCQIKLIKQGLALIAMGLVTATFVTACNSQPTADSSDSSAPTTVSSANAKELKLLYWQAPTTLNPHLSPGTKDREAASLILEPLAAYNEAEELEPILAAEIPTLENGGISADNTTVTWKLKEGVKWSDGEPFTAEDVVFTYQFITNGEVGATSGEFYGEVQSVEAVDDLTVKITFNRATPTPMNPFVGGSGMILPEHLFKDFLGAQARSAPGNTAPVGTNAFQVKEFKPGDTIIYEPNPNFRGEPPAFSTVELKGGGDAVSAARAVLQTGEADYAWNIQAEPAVIKGLEANARGEMAYVPKPMMERIYINFSDPNKEVNGETSQKDTPHPFLSEKLVREAISLAIDRETIAEQLYGEAGSVATNFLVSPEKYASPNTRYEFDLTKAAQRLDEAGWKDTNGNGVRDKNGVEMEILFTSSVNPVRQKSQEIIKQNLESIGMSVELKSVEAGVYFGDSTNPDSVNRFNSDLQLFAFDSETPEPDSYMELYACDQISQKENQWSKENSSRYCNPEYDALLEQLNTETDLAKRTALFVAMNDLLIEDVALIPLVRRSDAYALASSLTNLEFTPWAASTWKLNEWGKT
ncbi:MAG: peptide/nickel transport system substrate-binding protein [Phormidesmis priestleyi Ana]|uniref:Peptide/nickel transport system substrate-binding protein n=1 Tax=Phormidesmis priestleyi Ana TaxID=1666911 RepID=A0A0P8BP61_9CYAN|nr:MAG: peptide/nickel transport system substrate-binding protein [Phormidesmis priestleyi Ana]